MSQEIDEQCVRAMGWVRSNTPEFRNGEWIEHEGWRNHEYAYVGVLPAYSSDPAAACLLEDEIERRGLTKEYIAALWGEVGCAGHNGEGPNIWREEWLFIRATPEQRARAFLAAVL